MVRLGVGRSILLDASVNLVPFGILVVLLVFFVLADPWPSALGSMLLAVSLLLVPIVVLLAATAVVARILQADEAAGDTEASERETRPAESRS